MSIEEMIDAACEAEEVVGIDELERFASSRTLPVKPTAKGMTNEEIDEAWDAHLKSISHK